MNIIVNNETTEVKSVTTTINGISFDIESITINDALNKYLDVTELSVANGEIVHGIYENLLFASATVDAEGVVTINFHIKPDDEVRLEKLESTQTEQDEILAEIMFGGEL